MAFSRRRPCILLLPLLPALVVLSLLASVTQAATTGGPGDIVVFWGRNKAEGTLREACDTGTYTTVIISFLRLHNNNTTYYTLDLSGHPLAGVGADVKHCQSKGILVLLSIGGPPTTSSSSTSTTNYSLPSTQSASDLAAHLWDAYLGGSRPGLLRLFGDAALDGVDFYITDNNNNNNSTADHDHHYYDELVRRLHAYNNNNNNRSRHVTLTATVRCAYPEAPQMAAALATGLFARVHVRLYGDLRCTWADREAWEKWAAAYPASRVFAGVVAAPEADRDAYMVQKDLYYNVLQFAQKVDNYGGIMVWDRYYDKMNHYISSS